MHCVVQIFDCTHLKKSRHDDCVQIPAAQEPGESSVGEVGSSNHNALQARAVDSYMEFINLMSCTRTRCHTGASKNTKPKK